MRLDLGAVCSFVSYIRQLRYQSACAALFPQNKCFQIVEFDKLAVHYHGIVLSKDPSSLPA